ncbi:MAG: hypothetical protein EOT04_00965 [Candidatus Chaera renei]|uniref:YggT family protein n=1 Tax=Candidatus Chaera renei TaxID=2506947 RepID=A0A4Q0AJN3_9BACT|nr:MAG: hypothetical protein EOT04_00965 [Candidatus Chaera renei]
MATEEERTTEVTRTVSPDTNGVKRQTVSGPVFAERLVYYLGGAVLTLLLLRFLLALLGANRANPFADLVFGLSYPLVWPFFGLFSFQPSYGNATFESATLVAMVVYGIFITGLAKVFTLHRRDRGEA